MYKKWIGLALSGGLALGCQSEPAPTETAAATPPPPPAAAPKAPAAAAAPKAPDIVYASAEPQFGGLRKRVGDYMVELKTSAEGKVAAYVQKYEGDVPSFEDVQVEMQVKPRADAEVDEEDAAEVGEDAPAEEKAEDAPADEKAEDAPAEEKADEADAKEVPLPPVVPQDVIFFPGDGKLEATVAGLPKGKYDVDFRIYDIKDDKMAEAAFEGVEIEPLEADMTPKHDGAVKLVDKTQLELLQKEGKLHVWLRDLESKPLPPSAAALRKLVINLANGEKQELEVEPEEDHFVADITGQIDPSNLKILLAKLLVTGKEYKQLRVPGIARLADLTAKGPIEPAPKGEMTADAAKKGAAPGKMKGTVGTMAITKKAPPRLMKPVITPKAGGGAAATKTKKAKVSTAKKVN